MNKKRHFHTATALLDGRVLITGGLKYFPDEFHSTAELFDPVTGTFSYTDFMSAPRYFHTATRLTDGRVLLEGGDGAPRPAELFDPVTELFSVAATPTGARISNHAESVLSDGRVLLTGGNDDTFSASAVAELYDPISGTYAAAPGLGVPRRAHTHTTLTDGRVLVVGGSDGCPAGCSAVVYDTAATTVTAVGSPSVARGWHTATPLDDGTVLVVGGQGATDHTATAEVFDPSTNTFVAAGAMAGARSAHTATRLTDGSVLVAGGYGPLAARGAELYVASASVPLSLTVTPTTATLEVGATRAFTAVDHLGHPRADALWSVTNGSIATVDANTGLVTGVAAGTVTVTATLGAASGQAQLDVTAGPPAIGTPLWTVAAPPGTLSRQLIPVAGRMMAVSTSATDTELQGLTPDGQQQWRTWIPGAARQVVPNASGGVLLTVFDGCDGVNPLQLINIDGPTGIWSWKAAATMACNHDLPQIAIRHDGAVAVATPGNVAGFPNLMMLSGDTGAPLSVPTIPQSTFTSFNGQQTPGYSRVGPTMIDADGTTHLLFEKRVLAYPPQVVNTGIWLMSVRADQTWTTTQLSTTNANVNLFPGRIIPDGHDGLVTTLIESPIVPPEQLPPPPQSTFRARRVLAGGGRHFIRPADHPTADVAASGRQSAAYTSGASPRRERSCLRVIRESRWRILRAHWRRRVELRGRKRRHDAGDGRGCSRLRPEPDREDASHRRHRYDSAVSGWWRPDDEYVRRRQRQPCSQGPLDDVFGRRRQWGPGRTEHCLGCRGLVSTAAGGSATCSGARPWHSGASSRCERHRERAATESDEERVGRTGLQVWRFL